MPNGAEFFLNGNPLDPADNGMLSHTFAPLGENDELVFVLSFAAPTGADFEGGATATIRGVSCTVQGSLGLTAFDQVVTEIVPTIVPAGGHHKLRKAGNTTPFA